jgi:hypothetical protein
MFMAAFTSRLTTLPHLGQAHSLSLRVTSLLMYPQLLGSLVPGSNFPISKSLYQQTDVLPKIT